MAVSLVSGVCTCRHLSLFCQGLCFRGMCFACASADIDHCVALRALLKLFLPRVPLLVILVPAPLPLLGVPTLSSWRTQAAAGKAPCHASRNAEQHVRMQTHRGVGIGDEGETGGDMPEERGRRGPSAPNSPSIKAIGVDWDVSTKCKIMRVSLSPSPRRMSALSPILPPFSPYLTHECALSLFFRRRT